MSIFNIDNLPKVKTEVIEKPLVMLVDDEVENINVLRNLLESNYQIITGLNGREALELIDNMKDPQKIQLIISDQRMPFMTGVELFEKIVDKMPETIRIILTGYSDTQTIIDSINKANLYKFITKPFDPTELSLTVQRGIEAFKMRRELKDYTSNLENTIKERTQELENKNKDLSDALESLEKLSLSDQLTGTYNRHFLNKFMPQEMARFKREIILKKDDEIGFGLLIIDIDHFKHINDTFGHDSGDKVLIQFSNILKETCRESDWIVRWGGEEFVIIEKGLTLIDLQHLAERIKTNIASYKFDLGCKQSIYRTCSIGITSFPFIKNQNDAMTWEQTLNLADSALYIAKNNGRNTWISLFEKNITQTTSFYESAMINLRSVIEADIVSYNSSSLEKLINF